MPGKFLIDLTDARFQIAANEGVMRFVREVNPFAHSDVGTVLLELGKELAGARAYCPSFAGCAYVVLHTESDRIFAIAFGQRGLAFRVGAQAVREALTDGGEAAPGIGSDWVTFKPWDAVGETGARGRLRRWCREALAAATVTPR